MRQRERGIAVLTAILIVAVAASAAAMMLSQHSAMLDQTLLVSSRAQADQYATAGIDWARGVLAQDAQQSQVDSLAEGWAQPIVGLPIERAVVAGRISDEQGKFNLNNLVVNAKASPADLKVLQRILRLLDLSPELADHAAEYIDPNASDAYYLSLPRPYRSAGKAQAYTTLDELYRVRGFDARIVEKLRPHVTALPRPPGGRTTINGNTASEIVLGGLLDADRAKVAPILAERATKPWIDKGVMMNRLAGIKPTSAINPADLDVKSDWFSVQVSVQQDDVVLGTEALLKRVPEKGNTTLVWRRPLY
jgi:general secretion pathway protein K